MAGIYAEKNSKPRELVPVGNHPARCVAMVHIGTVKETIKGEVKELNKVRITWELPFELRTFDEDKGEQPMMFSKDYTLSMSDNANLRKMLEAWRAKGFTEEEAKRFDITKLLGVACMLNIIHSQSKSDATKKYEELTSVTPVPKGLKVPAQVNPSKILSYEDFDTEYFNSLPDFIKDKIKLSKEYAEMTAAKSAPPAAASKAPVSVPEVEAEEVVDEADDLPF